MTLRTGASKRMQPSALPLVVYEVTKPFMHHIIASHSGHAETWKVHFPHVGCPQSRRRSALSSAPRNPMSSRCL